MRIRNLTRNWIGSEKCRANHIQCNMNFSAIDVIITNFHSIPDYVRHRSDFTAQD